MFPSKLYEVQLSPPQKKYSCNSIFIDDLALDSTLTAELLEEDGKQMSEEQPKPLVKLLQEHFLPSSSPAQYEKFLNAQIQRSHEIPTMLRFRRNSHFDEGLILMMTSFVFRKKIIIYYEEGNNLRSQIVNFGFKEKLYLSKEYNRYQMVHSIRQKQKEQKSQEFEMCLDDSLTNNNDPVTPPTESKGKYEETDTAQKGSTHCDTVYSTSDYNIEDMFTPPKPTRMAYLSQSHEDARPKNELLASLSIGSVGNPSPQQQQSSPQRFSGKLKFYDEQKSYGFIVMDMDGSDIFVHSDDLLKAGVSKDILKSSKQGFIIRFSFSCLNYIGKYKKSRKAVDLLLLQQTGYPSQPISYFPPMQFCDQGPQLPQFYEQYRNFNYTA